MSDRIGRYDIHEVLGRGGMGVVYRAVDTLIGRTVAVKTILITGGADSDATRELRERLTREVKAAGALKHPNIVTVHDMGFEGDEPYVVMEFVEGRTLEKVLDEGLPLVAETLRILRDTAAALDYAHARGVIHRDIKPANILIDSEGLVKLADFGIAKVVGEQTMTEKGVIIGSMPFMAPEVLSCDPATPASDRFSLAVMAYAMLTGRRPFQADSSTVLFAKILNSQPRPAHEVNPWLPAAVSQVLSRALSKQPSSRHGRCIAFIDELALVCRPPEPPSPPADLAVTTPLSAPQPLPEPAPAAARPPDPTPAPSLDIAPPLPSAPQSGPTLPSSASHSPAPVVSGRRIALVAVCGAAILLGGWWVAKKLNSTPAIEARKDLQKTPTPPPPPTTGAVRENPRDGLKYVWIAPGRFRMGCSVGDTECEGDEKPARDVEITRGFWIGQTEVTQAAYPKLIGSNPSNFKGPALPVELVSWTEANAYCAAAGMRLPTEAEWEYAARGGSAASRYGNVAAIAWYDGNSGNKTHPVGEKQANGYGLYDVLGNVWEWVADWHDSSYYAANATRDPQGPASGQYRALRGGSWSDFPLLVRVSDRDGVVPSLRYNSFGFRCAGELR